MIGLFLGMLGALFGAVVGLAGGLFGVLMGLAGALFGLAVPLLPFLLIAAGIWWLVKPQGARASASR